VSVTVREAVLDGKIYVVFQPLVRTVSGVTLGYEALVRSELPDFPNPPALLQAAIETNYCGELGRVIRQMAVERCPNHPIFVNMHPDEFSEGWLVRPDDPISTHDQDVYLEITESVPLSHYRYCHSVLRELRSRGVKIAVDDLGAGYSNLKYIADLEPDVVKLDRELVAGLTTESPLFRLVCSIVDLCRDQGAKVVAEGVETIDELRAVMETGAHYVQGYLLARPAREPPTVDWATLVADL
jgi:EAL domain-containing protein (putative c-di-GMP-specific phosphodiesterase class I)